MITKFLIIFLILTMRRNRNSAIKICTEFESIDGLINNAGINHVSLFLMDKISNIKNVFQVNFFLN